MTSRKDFTGLRATRNLLLQSKFPKDNGSLSVYFKGQRYLNLEAEPRDEVAGYANSKALALDALKLLGVRKRSAKKGCGKAVVF